MARKPVVERCDHPPLELNYCGGCGHMICQLCEARTMGHVDASFKDGEGRRCLVCQGKKVGRAELTRQRHGAKEAKLLQRYRPDLVLELETGLALLATEMAQWPEAWEVDKHGTGNNPHVYLPGLFGAKDAAMHQCPCGRRQHLDWKWRLLRPSDQPIYIEDAGAVMYMIDGLSTRDVQ